MTGAGGTRIRPAVPSDVAALAPLRTSLWPESTADEHTRELASILAGERVSMLPLVYFVAESPGGELVGFVEAGLRSCADGCDPCRPAGYIEGWYVDPLHRRQGIGASLIAAAEEWARTHGCTEMASDTGIDNQISQHAHTALGFQEVEHSVLYRKPL